MQDITQLDRGTIFVCRIYKEYGGNDKALGGCRKIPGISRMHIIDCSEGKVYRLENAKLETLTVAKSPEDKSSPTKVM